MGKTFRRLLLFFVLVIGVAFIGSSMLMVFGVQFVDLFPNSAPVVSAMTLSGALFVFFCLYLFAFAGERERTNLPKKRLFARSIKNANNLSNGTDASIKSQFRSGAEKSADSTKANKRVESIINVFDPADPHYDPYEVYDDQFNHFMTFDYLYHQQRIDSIVAPQHSQGIGKSCFVTLQSKAQNEQHIHALKTDSKSQRWGNWHTKYERQYNDLSKKMLQKKEELQSVNEDNALMPEQMTHDDIGIQLEKIIARIRTGAHSAHMLSHSIGALEAVNTATSASNGSTIRGARENNLSKSANASKNGANNVETNTKKTTTTNQGNECKILDSISELLAQRPPHVTKESRTIIRHQDGSVEERILTESNESNTFVEI